MAVPAEDEEAVGGNSGHGGDGDEVLVFASSERAVSSV